MVEQQKYSKYAIASFVLSIFSVLLLWNQVWYISFLVGITFPISIIYGIYSLYSIRKENLKGKTFAIIGLTISTLIIIGIIISKFSPIK